MTCLWSPGGFKYPSVPSLRSHLTPSLATTPLGPTARSLSSTFPTLCLKPLKHHSLYSPFWPVQSPIMRLAFAITGLCALLSSLTIDQVSASSDGAARQAVPRAKGAYSAQKINIGDVHRLTRVFCFFSTFESTKCAYLKPTSAGLAFWSLGLGWMGLGATRLTDPCRYGHSSCELFNDS